MAPIRTSNFLFRVCPGDRTALSDINKEPPDSRDLVVTPKFSFWDLTQILEPDQSARHQYTSLSYAPDVAVGNTTQLSDYFDGGCFVCPG